MWEDIDNNCKRLKVPDGWLVSFNYWHTGGVALIFISDIRHEWQLVK